MKKITLFLLCLSLLMSVLCLSSCGGKDDKKNVFGNEIAETESQTDVPDTGADDTSKSSDSGKPVIETSKDDAASKLAKLGETEGYEITMEATDTSGNESKLVSACKDNIQWIFTDDSSGYAFVAGSDTMTIYEYNGEEWTMSMNMPSDSAQSLVDIYSTTVNMYLFYANSYDTGLEKDGTGSIAGRDCIKYKYTAGSYGTDVALVAYVDKELGITLKWGYDVKVDDESGSLRMEVTSFKTGKDVKIPDLPDAGEDYTDMTGTLGWPDNSFTKLIPEAPGTVTISMIEGSEFTAVLSDLAEEDFKDYTYAVKDAGFALELAEDSELDGATAYEGSDKDGNTAVIAYLDAQMYVKITKAPVEEAEEE